MNEVYNFRVGDMIYRVESDRPIVGVIYKTTPKYVYYAVCAQSNDFSDNSGAYVTLDNKTSKKKFYRAIRDGLITASYADGVQKRRKIEDFED